MTIVKRLIGIISVLFLCQLIGDNYPDSSPGVVRVLCSLGKHLTFIKPLSTWEFYWVEAKRQRTLKKCGME